ncbi:MAG TPA: DinB family protein [Candidatus Limnocylindria bacterium]|nr:DinB family protein [Candidatus Limnocylindria bacterium]
MTDAFLGDTVALLERTPRVVRALLDGLPDAWTGTPDTAGGWTPRDVVGHLISAELDDWMPRVEILLANEPDRTFEPFDRFAHVERDRDVPLPALIDRFAELRTDGLNRLDQVVSDADLDRRGRHPDLGEVTMRELLATWAVHDLDHVAQIYAALAGSHEAAVGPWKANLGIVLRRDEVKG